MQDFPKFHHVSTGDVLRQHVREGTPLGKEAKEYMDKGELVPDKLMIDLVMEDATPYLEEGQSLLLDGFPRTLNQAMSLENVIHVDMVLNLDIPTETIVDRISDRQEKCDTDAICALFNIIIFQGAYNLFSFAYLLLKHNSWIHPTSGRVYSYSYKPPKVKGKDDVTGEPLVQRDDDKPESVRKRLQTYDEVSGCRSQLASIVCDPMPLA